MVGQRLVHRPQPPTRVALPGGREGGAHRGRVVGVVVEDDDAADVALELEPATDAVERRQAGQDRVRIDPGGERAAGGHQPVDRHVPPDQRAAGRGRRACPGAAQAARSRGPCRRRPPTIRPTIVRRRLASVRSGAGRRRRPIARRTSSRRPDQPRQGLDDAPHPAVADVGDERRRRRRAARSGSIQAANARTTAASSAKTSGWSHSARDQDRDVRAVRVEVAGVLVGLDDEVGTVRRTGPRRAAGPRSSPAAAPRRSPTGPRPASTSRWSSQPDVVDLPCVPVDADEPPPAGRGRVGDDLLDALGLDAEGSRGDSSSGWSGSTEVTAFVTARRSTTAVAVRGADVRRVVSPVDGDPRRRATAPVSGSGPPASQAVTTAPAAAACRAAPALAAPPTPMTWMPRARARSGCAGGRGARPAADLRRRCGSRCRPRAPPPSSSTQARAAAALAAMFAARSPAHRNRRDVRAGRRSARRDVDQPDRLLGRAAVGAGDPGDPDAEVARPADRGRRRPSPARPGRSPRRGLERSVRPGRRAARCLTSFE